MTLGELAELLTEELGLDLSSDSTDASRGVYVTVGEDSRLHGLLEVRTNQDGDLVLVVAP